MLAPLPPRGLNKPRILPASAIRVRAPGDVAEDVRRIASTTNRVHRISPARLGRLIKEPA